MSGVNSSLKRRTRSDNTVDLRLPDAVQKKSIARRERSTKLKQPQLDLLRTLIDEHPDATMTQCRDLLAGQTGIILCIDTFRNALCRAGVTRRLPWIAMKSGHAVGEGGLPIARSQTRSTFCC